MSRNERSSSSAVTRHSASDCLDRWSRPITPNEAAWVEFIRLTSFDSDPAPTLERVQAMRRIFAG